MDLNLANKVVVVTGASRGVGLATVQSFVQEGATVVAGARTVSTALQELAAHAQVLSVSVDLATSAGPQQLVDAAVQLFGGVDVLVNNVGAVSPRLQGIASITDEQWLESLNLNLMSAVRASRAALPSLLERQGTIVNISSVNAFLPDPGVADYTVSKAALTNFSKALSKEVGPQGVRINTVSPGPITTDIWTAESGLVGTIAAAMGVDMETATDQFVAELGGFATGRFTRPEEVADLIVMIASSRAGNVTGADFVIDGGLIKTL
ncbi:oxidoreductase [Streptomyces sp. NBC_00271]|uniref:oxidoreductase n=1 Tax=Streptomyces sp. NBC_00271 TaxID=2975697 RepID=UPI002E2B0254|nr:oxidoreductase [Streptomyces sp. NBC_00271]